MKSLLDHTRAALVVAALLASSGGRAAAQQGPMMPAAPLAGGAAAAGGPYVDAHGNPIIMPASFGGPSNCAPYGGCPDGGYGGDAAYADFGGYGPDQCGPYYFDIAVAGVALMGQDLFKDVLPLGAVGLLGPTIIDLDNDYDDSEPGWQIAGRYDLGPLSILEATYMGVYDMGFHDTRISEIEAERTGQPILPFSLTSVFSGYGNPPIIGLDDGEVYNTRYQADLQSTEFSYRRYWVGYSPRITGTYLAGFRYVKLTEDLNFDAEALGGNGSMLWQDSNELAGFQLGGDGWLCLLQGLRFGIETKGGIYNNHYKFRHATSIPDPAITNIDFSTAGDQPSFLGEVTADLVADILPSFSIRVGYRAMYMSSLATVGNNIFPDEFADGVGNSTFLGEADVTYHGIHAGLEYIW